MKVSMIWEGEELIRIYKPEIGIFSLSPRKRKFCAEYKGIIGVGSTWMEAINNCCEMIKI